MCVIRFAADYRSTGAKGYKKMTLEDIKQTIEERKKANQKIADDCLCTGNTTEYLQHLTCAGAYDIVLTLLNQLEKDEKDKWL